MYGIRIDFNDGNPEAIQYLCYDEGLYTGGGGRYLSVEPLEPETSSHKYVVVRLGTALLTFLTQENTHEITYGNDVLSDRRTDFLEILNNVESRFVSNGGKFTDRPTFYKNLVFEVVQFVPNVVERIKVE